MIRTKGLTKRYKQFFAVNNVSLHVKKGEIYGFLGLNGAGKTTTLEMMLGLVRPTAGEIFLLNERVQLKHYHLWERVGYLLDAPYSYPELTVKENLSMFAQLRQVKSKKRVHHVIDQLNLQTYAQVRARNLSLGNRIRLGIARALLHEPEILILDEPVNGLDPAGIIDIRNLLQHLAYNENVTILMSSHLLDEVAKIATTVGIIHEGKLLKEITRSNLNKQLKRRLLIKTKNQQKANKSLQKANYKIKEIDAYTTVITDVEAINRPDKVAKRLVEENIALTHLAVVEESLEEYFLGTIRSD